MTIDTILITGATGFIGRHMVAAVLAKGSKVVAIHRRANDDGLPVHERLVWISAQNKDIFQQYHPNAVIHLATCYGDDNNFGEVLNTNVALPLRLLEEGARYDCRVFIATDSFFSKKHFSYSHKEPYVQSKNDFIRWAELKSKITKCPKIIRCRLEHVYGPGDGDKKFIPNILEELADNETIHLTPGDQLRDFVYVDDVVQAYLRILERKEIFLDGVTEVEIGTGIPNSIRKFVETAKELSGSTSTLVFGAKPHRQGEIMRSIADTSVMFGLGWKAKHSITSGIKATLSKMDFLGARTETKSDSNHA